MRSFFQKKINDIILQQLKKMSSIFVCEVRRKYVNILIEVFMKKIIIDFDEVICYNQFLQTYNEFFNTNKRLEDFDTFYIDSTIEDPEQKKAFGEYVVKRNFYKGATTKFGAVEIIDELSEEYEVYICTAYYMPYVRDLCGAVLQQKYEFIAKYMPNFNMARIIFTNSKSTVVGDIMIDDNLNNLLTNKAPQKILYTAQHNEKYTDEELRAYNITRVNNWREIRKLLLNRV